VLDCHAASFSEAWRLDRAAVGCKPDRVPRRPSASGRPRDYLLPGERWPGGQLRDGAPLTVRYAQVISRRFEERAAGRNRGQLAEHLSIHRTTLHDFLTGRTFPDIQTLAKAEHLFDARLWPELGEVASDEIKPPQPEA